ncbi:hypothetical protein EV361DRAFT_894586 [Lentinula raphanica]|uniref:MICOS complex subunit MIC10 n=1 Tax=Lentinula raphanica TaxID=153919 RepID=A0AA38UBY2_9AGAR|nr:hypothetical protein F5880DRAFT_1092233 [Lentinula raphanica]KAJ3836699.1 hypothetical protein F5878DRAFT_624505 [Lentinula raphanica]KAJ3974422.1 hypothetical protein EV361DRAFT_894586 [Lentinula raphanica]
MSSSKPVSSEDIIGQKYDRCLADFLVKTGVGFSVGVVASVILFKRRTFPIALSTGFGAGAAYADCDRSFNPARIPGTRIIPASPSPSGTAPDEHKHQV